ncbi:hypothetical protein [Kitasatospora sp. NPDC096140]|uniref:hypothetical protein n=1 Tax=Kitasatospora sp. NPDC096140 TaxID=3155425 RepID=UPI003324ACAA
MKLALHAAVDARAAAVEGRHQAVDEFSRTWLRIRKAEEWREAVSTALMGNWLHSVGIRRPECPPWGWPLELLSPESMISCVEDWGVVPMFMDGAGDTIVVTVLDKESRMVHQELQPLWQRKVNGGRLHLLDRPVSDGLALRDLITDRCGPEEILLGQEPDDPRVTAVLERLTPAERAVVKAWAYMGATTWEEAAQIAGADDPAAFGERVRRKLRRLGNTCNTRALQEHSVQGEAGLWVPRRPRRQL